MGSAASTSTKRTPTRKPTRVEEFGKEISHTFETWLNEFEKARRELTAGLRKDLKKDTLYSGIGMSADEEHSSNMDAFFLSFDTNNSGSLGTKEMANLIKALGFGDLSAKERKILKSKGDELPIVEAKKMVSMLRQNRQIRHTAGSSGPVTQPKVFLGGACGKTTWRKDIAIPLLEQAGVAYFNPQVDEWRPELVEIKAREKARAAVLIFVIDDHTAGISSLIEAAEYAAAGKRHLAVMLKDVRVGDELSGDA